MATFTANQGGAAFTPATSATAANNLVISADTAGDVGTVTMFGWGGRGTTSTGYRTRWLRLTTNGVTPSALTTGTSNSNTASVCSANTYATPGTGATDPAGSLFAIDWNLVGGGGVIVLPINGGWMVVGLAAPYSQIGCGNVAGADANLSSYTTTWLE